MERNILNGRPAAVFGAVACLLALALAMAPEAQAALTGAAESSESSDAVISIAATADEPDIGAVASLDLETAFSRTWTRLARILATAPLVAVGVAVVLIFWWIGRWLSRRRWFGDATMRNPFVATIVRQAIVLGLTIVGILIALDLLQATALVGAVLGAAGVLGIALGFAFRDLVENFIASVLLSLRQPFAVQDEVEIDGHRGFIISLNSRATILMTADGNHLRLPNAQVFKAVILNYTRNPKRRLTVEVGIGVEEDPLEAQRVGLAALAAVDGILANPAPSARIERLGDSSVQMQFFGWIDQAETGWYKARSESMRVVKNALEAAGMDLPEPIYRVHLSHPINDVDHVPSKPPRREKPPASSAPASPACDTAPDNEITHQIDAEAPQHAGTNLLANDAPRE